MSADSVPSSKTNIFQSKLYTLIYCRHFRIHSWCAMFDWSDTVFRRRNVKRRRISKTVLQPRYWGSEADSPDVCRLSIVYQSESNRQTSGESAAEVATSESESRLDNGVTYIFYRNRTRFRIHRPSVENSLVLIVASVKYNRGSEKNIENCFFHINLRPGAWTFCNKGVMHKLKRHGNGGSCFKKHEKLKN
jgi:hypothetical protein